MYRVGIIGLGRIACELPDNHYLAYHNNPETALLCLCDNKKDLISEWGKWNLSLWNDYLGMVKKWSLDIVSVCTPPETHREIVCNIAPYVKAIYCEKPIAETLGDADEMIRICHENNVILQINHQRNFLPVDVYFSRGCLNTGTHMYALIDHFLKNDTKVNIHYIEGDEHVFQLELAHNGEMMIPLGVEHLVDCIKNKRESIVSGEKGYEALKMSLYLKEKMGYP